MNNLFRETAHESPFLALRPALAAFQLLGVFNYSILEECSAFECRPTRLLYSLGLNLAAVAGLAAAVRAWLLCHDLSIDAVMDNMGQTFSRTDYVAFAGFMIVLEVKQIHFL